MGKVIRYNFNDQKIQTDIANWISRERLTMLSGCNERIYNRLKRKYKLEIELDLLNEKIKLYQKIYDVVGKNLPKYIFPSESGFAEPKYVKYEEIIDFISRKFPMVYKKTLEGIISWVVEHQYIR